MSAGKNVCRGQDGSGLVHVGLTYSTPAEAGGWPTFHLCIRIRSESEGVLLNE